MAMKAVRASDILNLDQTPDINGPHSLVPCFSPGGTESGEGISNGYRKGKGRIQVIGHRGSGMNKLHSSSSDLRMRRFKDNTIMSFNHAATFNLRLVEFDVQVTKDGCPVIFHDLHILTQLEGTFIEKTVTEISLQEFLSYGPQRQPGKEGKPLFRKAKDKSVFEWKVEKDDPLCTLQEAFENVDDSLGFNIELKLDGNKTYEEPQLRRIHQAVLKVVNEHAKGRPIIFSSFQPDAACLLKKLQDAYPVLFLTNGGCEIYADPRRNSLEEAVKLCEEAGLDGILSQAKAIFGNPDVVARIKGSKLSVVTYGQLNNVAEAIYMQQLMGVDGVIVDFVQEIEAAVSDFFKPGDGGCSEGNGEGEKSVILSGRFSKHELSFLLKLITELLQN